MPGFRPDSIICRRKGQAISHQRFLAQVLELAHGLPSVEHLINLCDDRYLFLLTLCAAQVRGSVSLFPPSRMPQAVEEVAARYPGAICIADFEIPGLSGPLVLVEEPDPPVPDRLEVPSIQARHDSILVFTSGSTGRPGAHPKRWGALMLGSRFAARRFGIGRDATIVATVPPQHMYGLELSILIPLSEGTALAAERPFFPDDIRQVLEQAPGPRILVTTPVHLAVCAKSGLTWPRIDFIISATAPLSTDLARAAELTMATRVFEIYGCTEAGSIASRRTVEGADWRWYESIEAHKGSEGVSITADFLPDSVLLSDTVEFDAGDRFRLLGRNSDMIKVAGKRASLGDLNLKLNSLDGVLDGVFVDPQHEATGTSRLAAVVVAPSIDEAALLRALRPLVDPAFLPRRILFVERLPRNETGKLPRERLMPLLYSNRPGHQ